MVNQEVLNVELLDEVLGGITGRQVARVSINIACRVPLAFLGEVLADPVVSLLKNQPATGFHKESFALAPIFSIAGWELGGFIARKIISRLGLQD